MKRSAIHITLVTALATCLAGLSCSDKHGEESPPDLEAGLKMFWRMDEGGNDARADQFGGVGLVPWQRTGVGRYSQNGLGTVPTPAKVGQGQHIDGATGYHFATSNAAAMSHAEGSFTWVAWVLLDKPSTDTGYAADQTLVAKWNSSPDTVAPADQREYRVWHDPATLRWNFEVSRNGLEGPENSLAVAHPTVVEADTLYFVEAWFDAKEHTVNLRVSSDRERGEIATKPWTEGVFTGVADLDVGAQNTCTDAHLTGVIDALGYWNRSLTDDESRALFRSGDGLEF